MISLRELVNSHQIRCYGLDIHQEKVLNDETAETVIVLVSRDGSSYPLCRYYNLHTSDCTANPVTEDETKKEKMPKFGECIYFKSADAGRARDAPPDKKG